MREALPRHRGISLLSGTRRGYELGGAPVDAVVDAGRRGGVVVVCDLPRRLTDATQAALDAADLVVVVSRCDVRACAATAAIAPVLAATNPNLGLVVRGPSPGGLRAAEVADITGLPLLASIKARAATRPAVGTRWPAVGTALSACDGGSPGTRRPAACGVGAERQGGVSGSLIDRVRERLASESAPLRPSVVAAAIRAESGGVLGDTEVLANLRVLETELTGAGILEPLLCADGTTDVLVTAPDAVWVDDGNGLRRSGIRFADEAAVRRLAQRLALAAGRRLDDAQPWVDGQLTGIGAGGFAVRLHAVLPPVAAGGTCLSLRVLRPATQDLAALTAAGAIDSRAGALVADIIAARLAFLVCGGTGAGKTTLLAALLGAVPPEERIVCVEDAAELAPRHPHLVKLVARCANVEGVGEVPVRELVRQALRMRPDRIVVGEVRGAEVVDLLAALNTGHDGGAGTVHANNPGEVPARLEALGALGGLDRAALHSQLAAAVQVLLHVARDRAGRRRLGEIAVLRQVDGQVRAVTVWHADRGMTDDAGDLHRLLRSRMSA